MTLNVNATPAPLYAHVAADYDIVIVGSGPAGLSAAARARQHNLRHVLLEAEAHASDTIYKYQKGKHVMAEPAILPLRSAMRFGPGKREQILGQWNEDLAAQGVDIRYQQRVASITREDTGGDGYNQGALVVQSQDGTQYRSRTVVLAIGLQGNIRKLGVPGENLHAVQYTLADPDEFRNETIVVVGAGDAAIENALALAGQNRVYLINRSDEFAKCKDGNRDLLMAAEKNGTITICYTARPLRVEEVQAEAVEGGSAPLHFVYNGKDGEDEIYCHRIIARLGATPPRTLIEGFGVVFPNDNPAAVPVLSDIYESNVPGLFIVGALGGYPLIKQAMNQGYEVVDALLGLPVEPVDTPLLLEKFRAWQPGVAVNAVLDDLLATVPLFNAVSRLQIREVVMESQLHAMEAGTILFEKNDYTNSCYAVLNGTVDIEITAEDGELRHISIGKGSFFGEMGLISGRRRTATVRAGQGCVVIETPRRTILKLMSAVDDVRHQIDLAFVRNAIKSYIGPMLTQSAIDELIAGGVEMRQYNARQVLFREGDEADGLYLIRRGSVTVSRREAGQEGQDSQEKILSYISAGNYVGEVALMNDAPRGATVSAAVFTEVLVLKAESFRHQLEKNPQLRAAIEEQIARIARRNVMMEQTDGRESGLTRFLLAEGVGEASDILLINENLCIQCNNCETACADTHNGTARLNREQGPTFNNIHLPIACRHCEHPHCMKDCPPNAISRSEQGEVFISDACIGCGNCERNCPYGVIQMAAEKPPKEGGLLSWLFFGLGDAPGQREAAYNPDAIKKAVKCDLCKELKSGPACVRSCPTGAAIRVTPEQIFKLG